MTRDKRRICKLVEEFTVYMGGPTKATKALAITQAMLWQMRKGGRGVSPAMAKRMELLSKGKFKREAFIWPEDY